MEAKGITIYVDAETAKAYESVIFSDQKKIDALLTLRLKKLTRKKAPSKKS